MVIKQALPFDIKYASINILDVLAADTVNGSFRRRITGIRGRHVLDADWMTIERGLDAARPASVPGSDARRVRLFLSSTVIK